MTAVPVPARNTVRVPNLPMGPLVDKDGFPTEEEQTFRQSLLTLLQSIVGDEGLVMPGQTTSNIATIAANTNITQSGGTGGDITTYTTAGGTMIYDTATDEFKVAILAAGVPSFKVVTVT